MYCNLSVSLRNSEALAADLYLVHRAMVQPGGGKHGLNLLPRIPLLRHHSHEAAATGPAERLMKTTISNQGGAKGLKK